MKCSFIVVVTLVLLATPSVSFGQSPIRLTLTDAVSRGLENSHRLAEIQAREEGAKAAAQVADLAKKPTFNASAGYSRTNHVEEFSFPQPNGTRLVVYPDIPDNFMTRLSFQWPIYTAGRADALERAAGAEVSAIAADIETARADLKLEITRAYWAAVTARETLRVLEESAARVDAQVRDARQRFDVGLIPPNEVTTLEAQRARERAQLIEASNVRESAHIDLRRLIGAPADAVLELVDPIAQPPPVLTAPAADAIVESARQSRPELKALAFRLTGAESRQAAASSANKPVVNLTGGVDYANPNPRIFPRKGEWQESWDVGVSVNWTFFDFGRTKAQVAEAAAAVKATRARMAEIESVISADVRQRLLDRESARAMVGASEDAVKSAAEARRVVSDRFAAGVATSTDVIVAQVALLETELARTRAMANLRLAEARLERTIGAAQ